MPKWRLFVSDIVLRQVDSIYCGLPDSHDVDDNCAPPLTRGQVTEFWTRFERDFGADADRLLGEATPFCSNPDLRLYVDEPFQLILCLERTSVVVEVVDFVLLA